MSNQLVIISVRNCQSYPIFFSFLLVFWDIGFVKLNFRISTFGGLDSGFRNTDRYVFIFIVYFTISYLPNFIWKIMMNSNSASPKIWEMISSSGLVSEDPLSIMLVVRTSFYGWLSQSSTLLVHIQGRWRCVMRSSPSRSLLVIEYSIVLTDCYLPCVPVLLQLFPGLVNFSIFQRNV